MQWLPNLVNVSDKFSWHHLVVLQKYMGGNCIWVHHSLQMTKRASMFFVMVCPSFCTVARAERARMDLRWDCNAGTVPIDSVDFCVAP